MLGYEFLLKVEYNEIEECVRLINIFASSSAKVSVDRLGQLFCVVTLLHKKCIVACFIESVRVCAEIHSRLRLGTIQHKHSYIDPIMETVDKLIQKLSNDSDAEAKRVITGGFEASSKLEPAKPDILTRRQRREISKRRREATAGAKWFDLPAKELEVEDKLTIDALRLRETLDPSRFYKKKSTEKVGKHFQIGTVIEHPIDYYSSRATRRERKQTLIDELISDAEFKKNVKHRYNRLRATNAIKKKEKALAERRKMIQSKRKQSNK